MNYSKKPSLPSNVSPDDRGVVLHGGGMRAGGLIESALTKLTTEQTQALMGKAGEEALRLEVKQREQNLDYVAGKKTIEDHIDAWGMLDKRGKLTRQSVTTEVKTGAGKMKIESKSGAACFVATAAFKSADHECVNVLRRYRSRVLSETPRGRAFIKWYWQTGPKIAAVG